VRVSEGAPGGVCEVTAVLDCLIAEQPSVEDLPATLTGILAITTLASEVSVTPKWSAWPTPHQPV
jgi:hypothetical protein